MLQITHWCRSLLHGPECSFINIIRTITNLSLRMANRPLVMCGPSGVGKSTLMKELMKEFNDCFGFSVSHTTRSPRPGETNGIHYHFVSREKMQHAIDNGEFIEFAQYSGNLYGTSRRAVEEVLKQNKICILDIDVQGVISIKETDLNPYYVFIKPPSIESLKSRLEGRGTETTDSLARRLAVARKEIQYGEEPGNFDIIIVNDVISKAYDELKSFMLPPVQILRSKKDE